MRASEFTLREPLTVSACTWNVAAKKPPAKGGGLDGWLQLGRAADIYAVGLQEVVDLSSPQNLSAGSGGQLSSAAAAWESVVTREIGRVLGEGAYSQLVCRQLVGIVLLVYVRKDLVPHCTTPRTVSLGTGLLGVMGNK